MDEKSYVIFKDGHTEEILHVCYEALDRVRVVTPSDVYMYVRSYREEALLCDNTLAGIYKVPVHEFYVRRMDKYDCPYYVLRDDIQEFYIYEGA